MPSSASTAARGNGNASTKANAGGSKPQRVLRFVASSHEHRELIHSETVQLGAATINSNPSNIDVNAYGFLAHIVLQVSWTGGVAGVLTADAPWTALQSIWLQDVNGAYFQYPLDGYSLLQEQVYGGYSFRSDPRIDSNYSATQASGQFTIRIPVQVTRHNGFGALANQNAAASYKLGWVWNTAVAFGTGYTTAPTFTANAYLEAWTQPNQRDLKGRPQAQLPPMHGSTQQWSYYTKAINVGNNVVQFPRVGNTIRTIILIARDNTGARNATVMPGTGGTFSLNLDGRVLTSESIALRQTLCGAMTENGSLAGQDAGVLAFYFNNSILGKVGDESSDLWIPTLQSSRLELVGTATTAGTLEILTNDIAEVETDQSQRYVMESGTGNLEHPDLTS
jgi:hypothetical protein